MPFKTFSAYLHDYRNNSAIILYSMIVTWNFHIIRCLHRRGIYLTRAVELGSAIRLLFDWNLCWFEYKHQIKLDLIRFDSKAPEILHSPIFTVGVLIFTAIIKHMDRDMFLINSVLQYAPVWNNQWYSSSRGIQGGFQNVHIHDGWTWWHITKIEPVPCMC